MRVVTLALAIVAGMAASASGAPRTLARDGTSAYTIFIGKALGDRASAVKPEDLKAIAGAKPEEQALADAVLDLRRCLEIKSGAALPIAAGDAAPKSAIRLALVPSEPNIDAYRLRTDGDDVVIEAGAIDGLRNGIYGLLTDHLDCQWFLPKGLGEEIAVPADRTVTLGDLDESGRPSFFSSTGMSWGAARKWDYQNRSVINRGRMVFGHSWVGYVSAAEYPYEKFPDMWARGRDGKVLLFDKPGWSNTNFCSTSPAVIEIVARKVNAYFKTNPDAIVASLDPNDLAPLCLCDRCLALDRSFGITEQDGKHMADRLLHFSKEIHDRLEPAYKDKHLGVLAYGFQTNLPVSAKAHDRHATMVCDFPPYFDHTRPFTDPSSPENVKFHEIVRGWTQRVKYTGFYDYYGHYSFLGPWGIIHKMKVDLPKFHEYAGPGGFLMIEAQPNFAMHGLNLYLAAQLAWNIDADVDALFEEYCAKFYGPAAAPMRAAWLVAERRYAEAEPGPNAAHRVAAKAGFWEEFEGHLKEAEQAVVAAPQRFRDRIAFIRDGFDYGRKHFEFQQRFAPRRGPTTDPAAALAFLKEAQPFVERVRKKYSAEDEYWPLMVVPWFYNEFDDTLKQLEAGKPLAGPMGEPTE